MLKIIEASDPIVIETIVTTFYSCPGIGKTSLAFTAEKPLLLDCDKGVHRSGNRRTAAKAETWADIGDITEEDVEGYKTLVMDTTGRALDLLSQDIIRVNPKHGRGGSLTLQGFGELKTRFAAYLKLVRSFGLDVVLLAHSDEKISGDDTIERIDMQGSSKQEVYKSTDAMARLGIVDGKRVLMFSPTETQFGKDPAGLGRVPVPDFARKPDFLAGIIAKIKASLNEQSAEMQEAAEVRQAWTEKVASMKTAKNFTDLIEEAADDPAKRVLLDAAVAKGFEFDGKKMKFVKPAGEEPEPEPEPEPEAEPVAAGGQTPLPF